MYARPTVLPGGRYGGSCINNGHGFRCRFTLEQSATHVWCTKIAFVQSLLPEFPQVVMSGPHIQTKLVTVVVYSQLQTCATYVRRVPDVCMILGGPSYSYAGQ